MNNTINYEQEALKLKSLLTVLAGVNPDDTQTLAEVPEVAKLARDIAETLYCGIVNKEV